MASASAPRLAVTVCDAAGGPVRVPGLAAWLAGLAPRVATGSLTLVVTSDRCIRRLNRLWRGIDSATAIGAAHLRAPASGQRFQRSQRGRRQSGQLPALVKPAQQRRTQLARR